MRLVKRSWLSQPKIASVGTCCLVGAIAGDMLYVANLGDSRAVLGRRSLDGKSVVAERLSTDHNVAVEEVRKEVVELHPDDSQIVVHTRGAWRIKGIIQVSSFLSFYLIRFNIKDFQHGLLEWNILNCLDLLQSLLNETS